jgi:VWFA-related protein
MKSAAVLLVLLAIAVSAVSQTPYIETFEVRLQNLDVVVTDAKGKPVRGLTKEDFVVLENGKPQAITNFAIYDTAAGTASSANAPAAAQEAGDVVSAPPPRRFVFFVDELGVQRMARQRLYNNVKAFVDAMRPGDVAAVVRPTTKEKIVQEFTGDRAAIEQALKAAIDDSGVEFSGSKVEISNLRWQLRNAATPQLRRAAKREYADAAARRVAHRLGQVRALTSSLAGVEGKKIVILVATGLTARPGSEAWDHAEMLGAIAQVPTDVAPLDREDDSRGPRIVDTGEYTGPNDPDRTQHPVIPDYTSSINEIARNAAANGVTIYALEPDVPLDVATRGNVATPMKNGLPDPAADLPRTFQSDFLQNAEVTLATLTKTTGGQWFRGLGNIDDIFRQVNEDSSFYYSLAYRATGEAEEGKRVAVSVRNRPELRVRTRTEVLEKTTDREMGDLVVASLLYPRTVNELGITVTPGTPQKDRGWYTIPVDVVIPLKNLTFLPTEGGKYAASFDLHYAAAGERRDFGMGGKRQQLIEITPEQYAALGTTTYRYKTGIQVSPGRARIAIGVLDTTTKLTGFRTVEVIAQ